MKVSVIIPVYNAEKYVREAVESALNQPETGEIILVEDASPDNSLEVCQQLEKESSKVRVLRHEDGKNKGAGASRNLGIKKSQYDYIAFLDADDFYLPNHFRKPSEIFRNDPDEEIDGVYEAVGTHFEDQKAQEKWFSVRNWTLTTVKTPIQPEYLLEAILTKGVGWFHTDGIVVRKSIFEKTGYFDKHLEIKQDSAMFLKMAAIGRLLPGRLQEPVSMRRVHNSNRWLTSKEKDNYYNFLLWETLFIWAYSKWEYYPQITNKKISILWNCYINCVLSKHSINYQNKVKDKIKKIFIFYQIARQYPKMIRVEQFWKVATNLLGWQKVKSVFINK